MRAVRSLLALKRRDNDITVAAVAAVTAVAAVAATTDHVMTDQNKK